MRSLLAYLLVFAVLLPSVSPWGTIAYYQLNRDYIARVLCQNRDKPQLHCDGQCYLARQLKAQQDKQDKETTERVQNAPTIQLFCADAFVFTCQSITANAPVSNRFAYLLRAYSAPLSSIFQPPGLRA